MGPQADADRLAAEWQSARTEAALQRGWSIRHDPVRGEFTAAREMVTARTLDGLLDQVEEADEGLTGKPLA